MKRAPRFLIAVHNRKTTGTGASALALARGLSLLGARVLMVVEAEGSLAQRAWERSIETTWPTWKLPLYLRSNHVVVCHRTRDHLVSLLSLGLGTKRVRVWSHLEPPQGLSLLLCRLSHLVVFPWHSVERRAQLSKTAVVYGGIDADPFLRTAGAPKVGKGPLTIGMVSRLKPGRGHLQLLRASAALPVRHRLIMVGDGELAGEIESEAQRLGVSPRLEIVREKVADYPGLLSSFDLLVYLAPGSDATCRTVFEAMACGVPVVVAPIGDLAQTCEGCGVVLEGAELWEALLLLVSCPKVGATMGLRGRDRVLRCHTIEKRAERIIALAEKPDLSLGEDEELSVLQVISRKGCDSGGGLQALQLTSALGSKGVKVLFSARGDGSCLERSREFGVEFCPLPMRGEWDLPSVVSLMRLIRERGVNLIHVHKGLAHSLAMIASLLLLNSPAIVANRGVSFSLERWNRWRYKGPFTQAVVAVSHSVGRQLVEDGISPEKVEVVHGAVDLKMFSPSKRQGVREELSIPDTVFLVGFIAAMRPWKNHRRFAELMAPIMVNNPNIHCLFAGGEKPKVRRAVVKTFEDAGLQGRFHLLGYRNDVERIIAACDLTVNLSTAGEGMPGVLRESLACEVPVLATPVAGNPEVVLTGHTGLVLNHSGSALPSCLLTLKNSPRLRRVMGKKGRRFVERWFSVERRVERMLSVYRQALDG